MFSTRDRSGILRPSSPQRDSIFWTVVDSAFVVEAMQGQSETESSMAEVLIVFQKYEWV